MIRGPHLRCFAGLVAAAAFAFPNPPLAAEPLVLEDVTVIDGTGAAPRSHQVVVVVEGRIEALGAIGQVTRPKDATVLDGRGRFVLPGFVDLHAHVTFLRDPDRFTGYDRGISERLLRILLAHGITTVRNPAAPAREGVALREDVRAGRVLGPRILTAGEVVNRREGEATADEVRAEVRRQAALGVDYVKVYAAMPPAFVRAAVEEAHRAGVRVVGHLGATTPTEGVAAGIDAVTHGASWTASLLPPERRAAYEARRRDVGAMRARIDWLEWLDLDAPQVVAMIESLAQARVPVDPTLITYATKLRGRDPQFRKRDDLARVPGPVLATWDGALDNWSEDDFRRGAAVWPTVLELVKRYHEAGVLLCAGSDLPNPWVIPGVGLHDELELLVEAGIPPRQVLRIATRNGAEALGLLQEVGTVEVGKRADLVVLGADPEADIRNTRSIERVILGGTVHDPARLAAR